MLIAPPPSRPRVCSASIAYMKNRTGSLSPRSSASHAKARGSAADHAARTLDFPHPA